MAATVSKPRRRVRSTDPAGRLTLRLGKEEVAFLAAEAGKSRLATAEYVRNLIVRGMQARELDETVAEVRAMFSELRATARGGTEALALETLFEVRAMRAIAAVRDPLVVTNARDVDLRDRNQRPLRDALSDQRPSRATTHAMREKRSDHRPRQ